jgi:hypothetical protein
MTTSYSKLSTGQKRLVWVGYLAYLIWMNLLGGWDLIIDGMLRPITYNDYVAFGTMFLLYWAIIFVTLWVIDGFDKQN